MVSKIFKFFICHSDLQEEEDESHEEETEPPDMRVMRENVKKVKSDTKYIDSESNSESNSNSKTELRNKLHSFNNIEPLKYGAFSKVYTAYDSTGEVVVLKKVKKKYFYQIKREVNLLELIDSSYIITIYGIYETNDSYVLVLPYYDYDLFDNRSKIIGRPNRIFKILLGISKGISDLHKAGYMHGDLKLENVMLDSKYNPIIIDLGMSKKIPKLIIANNYGNKISGTLHYLPPEILDYHIYTEKMDIWGLGVIMYILMFGIEPFGSLTEMTKEELFQRIKYQTPEYPETWICSKNKIYRKMVVLNKKLLKKQFKNRPNIESVILSIEEIKDDLKKNMIERSQELTHDKIIEHLKSWKTL